MGWTNAITFGHGTSSFWAMAQVVFGPAWPLSRDHDPMRDTF